VVPSSSSVGISQHLCPKATRVIKGGILKHRFSDFLVYEIGTKVKGQRVRLESLKGPEREAEVRKVIGGVFV
jgi:hypothetical protein